MPDLFSTLKAIRRRGLEDQAEERSVPREQWAVVTRMPWGDGSTDSDSYKIREIVEPNHEILRQLSSPLCTKPGKGKKSKLVTTTLFGSNENGNRLPTQTVHEYVRPDYLVQPQKILKVLGSNKRVARFRATLHKTLGDRITRRFDHAYWLYKDGHDWDTILRAARPSGLVFCLMFACLLVLLLCIAIRRPDIQIEQSLQIDDDVAQLWEAKQDSWWIRHDLNSLRDQAFYAGVDIRDSQVPRRDQISTDLSLLVKELDATGLSEGWFDTDVDKLRKELYWEHKHVIRHLNIRRHVMWPLLPPVSLYSDGELRQKWLNATITAGNRLRFLRADVRNRAGRTQRLSRKAQDLDDALGRDRAAVLEQQDRYFIVALFSKLFNPALERKTRSSLGSLDKAIATVRKIAAASQHSEGYHAQLQKIINNALDHLGDLPRKSRPSPHIGVGWAYDFARQLGDLKTRYRIMDEK
ncbi:hypothetical protein F4778DRAFT_784674 [Xylariomycetidae sp. FL2044]|nr:hypothetical protein F4778DRAFT_784674 [Xylariomycetidae sp. FL2044]